MIIVALVVVSQLASVVAKTERPVAVADGAWRALETWDRDAYLARTPPSSPAALVPLRAMPADATPGTRFGGDIVIKGKSVAFALDDGAGKVAPRLRVDANADGKLDRADDVALERRADGNWRGLIGGARFSLAGARLTMQSAMQRSGTVRLADGDARFRIVSEDGAFAGGLDLIDIDGARFDARRGFVIVRGAVYRAQIARDADSLTLTPSLPAPRIERAIAVGDAVDRTRLAPLAAPAGAVLLVFGPSRCAPCAAQLPGLAAAHAQLAANGVEVVGVSGYPDDVGDAPTPPAWRTLEEPFDGALHAAFGVARVPWHVLIDRSGKVTCAGTECLAQALTAAPPL